MEDAYSIELKKKLIGHSFFEAADVPMGVLMGKIMLHNNNVSLYTEIKAYCITHNVPINMDFPEDKFISTQVLPDIVIKSPEGNVIQTDWGAFILGGDKEGFEIHWGGHYSDFIKEKFPNHYDEYYG